MKALIAAAYYHPRLGGLENYAAAIASGLRGLGWDVVVVCSDSSDSKIRRESFDGYTVWRLPVWKVVSNTPLHPSWYTMVRKIIDAENPDVINAHTPVPYMVEVVSMAARRVPVVVTYHAATLFKKSSPRMSVITYAYQAVQALTLRRADGIIAVSPYVKAALGDRLASKTEVIPNAVSRVSPLPHTGGDGLVFVANLEPSHAWKGLDLILDSLAIVRDKCGDSPRLTVIGDGADRPRYEQRVRALGLAEAVSFTGALTGSHRDNAVRKAAVQLIYPATANDGMPTVLLEGWAGGLPVIAADIGPISAVVEHGKTGILVPPNSPPALADAIRSVLADRAAAEKMGETARLMVEQEYTWPRQVERTARLFRDMIKAAEIASARRLSAGQADRASNQVNQELYGTAHRSSGPGWSSSGS